MEKNPIDALVKGLADSGCKITFGIQKSTIDLIEEELDRYDTIQLPKGYEDQPKHHMIYSKNFWGDVGKKVGWCPFTLALHYFYHLNKTLKQQ